MAVSSEKNSNGTVDLKKLWAWENVGPDTICITDYKGEDACVEIPATIDSMRVVAIEAYAFSTEKKGRLSKRKPFFQEKLFTVIIPEGVTRIGKGAFSGCNELINVTIPNTVTEIEEEAFKCCSGLFSLTIPPSVTMIGANVFRGCQNNMALHITDLVLWSGIKKQFDYFKYKLYLNGELQTDLVLPTGLSTVEGFANVSSFKSVTIPGSVTKIGAGAFQGCVNLTSVTIPGSVTEIGAGAFQGCVNLTSVAIPDSVTEIRESAFQDCKELTSIAIPNSVVRIATCAFGRGGKPLSISITDLAAWCKIEFVSTWFKVFGLGCPYKLYLNGELLTDLVIPEGSTTVGNWTFCESLASVSIPATVNEIAQNAFAYCPSLSSITVAPENQHYYSEGNCLIEIAAGKLLFACKNATVPNDGTIAVICRDSFSTWQDCTAVTIPYGVDRIESGAFSDCKALTSITIPPTVSRIESGAFSAFWGKKTIHGAPGSVAEQYAKMNHGWTFEACTFEHVERTPAPKRTLDFVIDGGKLLKYKGEDSTVTVPDTVVEIEENAFADHPTLIEVLLPNTIRSIGAGAFHGCTALTTLSIPDTITAISGSAFTNCKALTYTSCKEGRYLGNAENPYTVFMRAENEKATACTIHKDTKLIFEGAFKGCKNLTNITIPEGVVFIGTDAFRECAQLSTITIPDTVQILGRSAFRDCSSLVGITLSKSIRTILSGTFQNCTSLAVFPVQDGVEAIEDAAFRGCNALTDVVIPDSVKVLGEGAFTDCRGLKTVKLPYEMHSIAFWAFSRCPSLERIILPGLNCFRGVRSPSNFDCFGPSILRGSEGAWIVAPAHSFDNGSLKHERDRGALGYLTACATYPFTDQDHRFFEAYIKQRKSVLYSRIIANKNSLRGYLLRGLLDVADYDQVVQSASVMADVELNALLLAYSNEHAAELHAIREKNMVRALNTDPNSVTARKKLWAWESITEDTVRITNYKGEEEHVEIPATIGKMRVVEVGACAMASTWLYFDSDKRARPAHREAYFRTKLRSVTIPDSVKTIERAAFRGCLGLTTVTIGRGVTEIESTAFDGCRALESIRISNFSAWCRIGGSLPKHKLYLNDELVTDAVVSSNKTEILRNCISLSTITITDRVKKIKAYAFEGCTALTSVTIPPSVKEIGWRAFEGCTSLNAVHISDLSSWCRIVFDLEPSANPLTYAHQLYLNGELVTCLQISDDIPEIYPFAFSGCTSLSSVILQDTTIVGWAAFDDCTEISYHTYDNGDYLGSESNPFAFFVKPRSADVVTCEIHPNTKKILDLAFFDSKKLTEVHIPEGVKTIGGKAFFRCTALKSVIIPESVKEIEDSAFEECKASFTIRGKSGSYAEAWAKKNEVKFKKL